jgi:DNA-directed RNA polymerase specialized sigma24 family protein
MHNPRREHAFAIMTTLDTRLYAWLLESDERRFDVAFNAYFAVAYPAVIGRIARLSNWDRPQLEELAQDTLLKFFGRVGRGRRESSEVIKHALAAMRPLDLGSFHERRLGEWRVAVASYQSEAMNFQLPPMTDAGSAAYVVEWKAAIRALAERIAPLQRQGWHLIDMVRFELERGNVGAPTKIDHDGEQGCPSAPGTPVDAERWVEEVLEGKARAVTAENRIPGVIRFVELAFLVIGAIPRLRVPTNAYLFEIAMTLYLDESRKRARQKRGGRVAPWFSEPHPIDVMSSDPDMNGAGDEPVMEPVGADHAAFFDAPSSDPVRNIEDEQFLERFYDFLRTPLDEAIDAYDKARSRGRAVAERRKLDSLHDKFSRTIDVLSLMGEGYSQDQIAARLGISRNQVKYTIEVVQEAFARFTSHTAAPERRNLGMQVESYVR